MTNAKPKLIIIIGMKATKDDFLTKGNLDRVSSSSNEPSKTININPIVPKIGRTDVKFGISILKKLEICFTPQPKNNSKITEGILVRAELTSKT